MQAHQPQGGDAEASTNAQRTRPPMTSHRLDLPSLCDICGKARSTRKHRACSRIRQQRKTDEWAAFMSEKVAVKEAKKRRFAR
ncbi:hypothetical protein D3C84_1108910 [compost metagenome]